MAFIFPLLLLLLLLLRHAHQWAVAVCPPHLFGAHRTFRMVRHNHTGHHHHHWRNTQTCITTYHSKYPSSPDVSPRKTFARLAKRAYCGSSLRRPQLAVLSYRKRRVSLERFSSHLFPAVFHLHINCTGWTHTLTHEPCSHAGHGPGRHIAKHTFMRIHQCPPSCGLGRHLASHRPVSDATLHRHCRPACCGRHRNVHQHQHQSTRPEPQHHRFN